jgi:sterol desaturase/sphingolipid hydroxylase (fatty acid hydroxylase superfamily)
VYTTFNQHPLDLLFTNILPVFVATLCLSGSTWFLSNQMIYKTLIEVGGHSGKDLRGTSFQQFIWLPKYFGIELYSRDHNLHHLKPMNNFSKRFNLWDKVFGTFQSGATIPNNISNLEKEKE